MLILFKERKLYKYLSKSFYKCPLLFFGVQCDIIGVLPEKTFKL